MRRYTRTDFAALRAFVQRIEPATIARLHYDTGDPERAPHAATPEAMAHYLGTMRDELVRLALVNGSHVLADHLKTSIRKHGSAKLTAVSLRMVEQAAQLAAAAPAHGVGLWFRAADCAAPDRRGHHDPRRTRRLLQPSWRQLVAFGAAHQSAACADDRRVAAPARADARCRSGRRRR